MAALVPKAATSSELPFAVRPDARAIARRDEPV
jgi:hypothetical protein